MAGRNHAAHERDIGGVEMHLDVSRGLRQLRERRGNDRQHQLPLHRKRLADHLPCEYEREIEDLVGELLLVASCMIAKQREQAVEVRDPVLRGGHAFRVAARAAFLAGAGHRFGGLLFRQHSSILLLAALLLKFPLCRALLQRRVGAAAVLILWETLTMLVALANLSLAAPAQLALFLSASAGSTLIALSLPLFAPTPE